MSGDVVARAKAALDATRCTDEMQEFFRVGVVRELVEELEMQTSLQGLSVQIPEYGEWGSETLLYLFQDFGIQPGDDYQAASARQGDLLRSLAAANAEVEKLRRGGKELGRIIERQCRDVLNITGLHHLIGPDGDGDWGLVWERLAEMAAAGAEVEKLRAALETIKAITTASELAHKIAVDLCGGTPSPFTVVGADILAVIERAGIEP